MAATQYVVRDDEHYTVVVGWEDRLETFFARVFSRTADDGEPLYEIGTRPQEIRALSFLVECVQGYASLDADTVTALRHDATPLTG
jgi:hypothetical protein